MARLNQFHVDVAVAGEGVQQPLDGCDVADLGGGEDKVLPGVAPGILGRAVVEEMPPAGLPLMGVGRATVGVGVHGEDVSRPGGIVLVGGEDLQAMG